jgi:hypothetical protein
VARVRIEILLAVAAATAGGGAAVAQTLEPPEGPVIVGERKAGWKGIELLRLDAFLDFFGEYTSDELRQTGLPTLKDRETQLRETLDLSGEMFVGHPNLLTITGTAQLGIEDRFIDSDSQGGEGHDTDLVNLFDVRGLLLGEGPLPVTLYARRDELNLNRDFGTSIDDTTLELGAVAQIVSTWAPTTLRYFHLDNQQDDPFGPQDSSRVQDTFSGQSNMDLAPGQRLELNYTFDHIDETRSGGFANLYDRHDASATHNFNFGDQDRHNLRSYLRYYEETGEFPLRSILLDEQLTLRHTERLETRYFGSFENREVRGDDQRIGRLSAQIRYRLFESLVMTGTGGWRRLEVPDVFTTDDLFTTGTLEYTKLVPMGRVDGSAGLGFNHQDNSERGTTVSIANESYILGGVFPATINRRNVVESSVVVRRANGQILVEGIDYTLEVFPDRTEIRRVVGGGISEGETVLVDYDVGPEPASQIDTVTTALSLRYTVVDGWMTGAAVYGAYRTTNFSLDTVDPSRFVLDDASTLLYGVEYNRGGLNLKAERENRDSNVNPYDTTRLEARYNLVTGIASSVGASVTHEIVDYSMPDNHVVLTRVEGNWTQRFGTSLHGKIRVLYRDEQDDLSGDTRGFEQYLETVWRKGQTTVYVNVRNSFLDGPGSETLSQGVQFGLRRSF